MTRTSPLPGLALAALLAAPAAAQDRMQELMGACFAQTGSFGQAATLLSTLGWQVGGDAERAIEARAMVLPYLMGRDEQDLRRNGLEYYKNETLALARQEAVYSGILTSPEGHTLMMTHTGETLDCTLAIAEDVHFGEITDSLPEGDFGKGEDPQMSWENFRPETPPPGVTDAEGTFWDSNERRYTTVNPPRPRHVDLIVTTRVRMQ